MSANVELGTRSVLTCDEVSVKIDLNCWFRMSTLSARFERSIPFCFICDTPVLFERQCPKSLCAPLLLLIVISVGNYFIDILPVCISKLQENTNF